ncbi:MAG TPA: asparagine synthase-related protein [Candidatus Acidoferrales bacterium]|nr:asparagine synthase-related protein [Candidatus Acidoferrales bacterium]
MRKTFRLHERGENARAERFERDGVALVLDGEIYQPSEERGAGDAARLAALYGRRGSDFLRDVRGAFSLALVDERAQRMLLAVDPFATRSLYYWQGRGRVVFASRISHLARYREIPLEPDPDAIHFYLNHSFIAAPYTIYRDVRRLRPGEAAVWENGKFSLRQYWELSYEEEPRLEAEKAAALVRAALEQSVAVRLRKAASEKTGAFLSGGTDSSTVVGLMTEITGSPVKVFSVGFEEQAYNETSYARIAARRFGSEAFECVVRPKEALEIVPALAREYDEPFGNSSALPTYCCVRMARDAGVEVLFAGDGGDELFAGNERYLTDKILSFYRTLPQALRRCLDPIAEALPPVYPLRKIKSYVRRANQPNPERFLAYQLYVRDHAEEFFSDDFRALLDRDFPVRVAREYYERAPARSELNKLLYLDLKTAIADNDLFKVNRAAQAFGLAVRYPFLDRDVADVAGRIPARLKIKGREKRYIFKQAFRELLPGEILRKRKHGFGLPTGHWLRSDPGFRDLARSLLLDRRSVQRGYFKRKALEDLLARHDEERSYYYGSIIWNFMMLELWHRAHADSRPSPEEF